MKKILRVIDPKQRRLLNQYCVQTFTAKNPLSIFFNANQKPYCYNELLRKDNFCKTD